MRLGGFQLDIMYTKEMVKEVVDRMSNGGSTACQDVYLSPILFNPCISFEEKDQAHTPPSILAHKGCTFILSQYWAAFN